MPQRSNSSRYLYGDRNPLSQHIGYFVATVAPHAETMRAVYTVPTGKKALIGNMYAKVTIDGVAAPAGVKQSFIRLFSMGNLYIMNMAEMGPNLNTVGNNTISVVASGIGIFVTDEISLRTKNNGTGGTCEHHVACVITEYDA